MLEPDFILRDKTVAIVGLGLMGGSLALALRDKNAARQIIAIDTDPSTRARAEERGIAAYETLEPIAEANLIILATPVRTIIDLLPRIGGIARPGAIVMDLGSIMREIVLVMEKLPAHLEPISAHPMCGKETAGFHSADSTLYQNSIFVLTPLARTKPETITLISALATLLGARPTILDAERHDKIVAAISHLPYAVASALMLAANDLGRDDELLFTLAASGFRDTSRLAASDVQMMLDILLTNSANVAHAMREYAGRFETLAELVDKRDETALRVILQDASEKRREMIVPRSNEIKSEIKNQQS